MTPNERTWPGYWTRSALMLFGAAIGYAGAHLGDSLKPTLFGAGLILLAAVLCAILAEWSKE